MTLPTDVTFPFADRWRGWKRDPDAEKYMYPSEGPVSTYAPPYVHNAANGAHIQPAFVLFLAAGWIPLGPRVGQRLRYTAAGTQHGPALSSALIESVYLTRERD